MRSEFELSDDTIGAVAEICRRLDGIPLALELAAARLRTMTVHGLNEGLEHRFQLLNSGSRTALPRHQTLRGMVDWSIALLNDRQRAVLYRLAVFAGGWTREAAEFVCADENLSASSVLDVLDELVERSLVALDDWRGKSRYRLLDAMRELAIDGLLAAHEESRLRRRHCDWFVRLLESAPHDVMTDELLWTHRMDAELENIRSAMDWCVTYEEHAWGGWWTSGSGKPQDKPGCVSRINVATGALNPPTGLKFQFLAPHNPGSREIVVTDPTSEQITGINFGYVLQGAFDSVNADDSTSCMSEPSTIVLHVTYTP